MRDLQQWAAWAPRKIKTRLRPDCAAAWRVVAVALAACAVWSCAARAQAPAAGSPQAQEQKTMLVEPPAPLLPATLGRLTRVAEGDVGDGLGQLDTAGLGAPGLTPNDKAVVAEDGLKRFARSDYAEAKGSAPRGNITVYSFRDVSGAISTYDYLRRDGMRAEKLGDAAVSGGDELLMRSGPNVVVVHTKLDRAATFTMMKQLIDRLPKAMGPAGVAPLLPSLLPEKRLDADSVKYALGPAGYTAMGGVLPAQAVGFDKNAETVTAKYKGGGVLTLMLFPTPQIAGEHGRAAEAALNQQGTAMKIRREGTLVALATGPWPAAEAQQMVDSAHLNSMITLDKPVPLEFHAEVQKTYTLLESIAIFCALGALAAVVLGIVLGFGRALIRVMQGKPAATEPEFLRIDLRGIPGKGLRRAPDKGPGA